jgi:hypothetical protein
MTVSFSLLDEFKATVWRQARVLDRESLPSFPAVFPILRRLRASGARLAFPVSQTSVPGGGAVKLTFSRRTRCCQARPKRGGRAPAPIATDTAADLSGRFDRAARRSRPRKIGMRRP